MKNMELNNLGVQEMNAVEMKQTNGGNPIAIAALAFAYFYWASNFCYKLGKD